MSASAAWTMVAGLLLQGAGGSPQEDAWDATWERLGRWTTLEAESAEAQELRAELLAHAETARAAAAELERVRGWLLAAQLQDTQAGATLVRLPLAGLDADEAWLAAEVLPSGPRRCGAVLQALAGTPSPTRDQLLFAWNTAVEEARALRLQQGALPVQRILHERYLAGWSAVDLALTLSRLGREQELNRLMAATIAREEAEGRPTGELWSRWGIALLGFGDESTARDYLGRALARGSGDAALVLSLLELRAGRREAARRGFRPSILSEPPGAWALRGWGQSLLPEALRDPVTPPPQRQL